MPDTLSLIDALCVVASRHDLILDARLRAEAYRVVQERAAPLNALWTAEANQARATAAAERAAEDVARAKLAMYPPM